MTISHYLMWRILKQFFVCFFFCSFPFSLIPYNVTTALLRYTTIDTYIFILKRLLEFHNWLDEVTNWQMKVPYEWLRCSNCGKYCSFISFTILKQTDRIKTFITFDTRCMHTCIVIFFFEKCGKDWWWKIDVENFLSKMRWEVKFVCVC